MEKGYDFSNGEKGKFYSPIEELETPICSDKELEPFPSSVQARFVCIYGRSGAGKTRMLRSLSEARQNNDRPEKSILVGAETLIDEMVTSLSFSTFDSFRSRYEGIESLYVDNIWVLWSKPALTQGICKLIINRLRAGRRTVVASEFSLEEWRSENPTFAEFLSSAVSVSLPDRDFMPFLRDLRASVAKYPVS